MDYSASSSFFSPITSGSPSVSAAASSSTASSSSALGAATVAGLYVPGWIGYYGGNLAIFLVIPFFFVGLAVVHAWCRGKSAGTFMLIAFYVVMVFFGWLVLVIAVLGLIEQWVGLRRRFT